MDPEPFETYEPDSADTTVHECSEIGNLMGGYDCTCGEAWLDSYGGCLDAPAEDRAKRKAAWDAGQERRAQMIERTEGPEAAAAFRRTLRPAVHVPANGGGSEERAA